jgi:hypothetical protein
MPLAEKTNGAYGYAGTVPPQTSGAVSTSRAASGISAYAYSPAVLRHKMHTKSRLSASVVCAVGCELGGLFEVDAPFWPVAFLHIGRAIDLAGVGHALHQFVLATACVDFGRCGLCRRREAGRNDLLWFADPTHTADACAALLEGNEATICATPNAVNTAPSGGLAGSTADQPRQGRQQAARPD